MSREAIRQEVRVRAAAPRLRPMRRVTALLEGTIHYRNGSVGEVRRYVLSCGHEVGIGAHYGAEAMPCDDCPEVVVGVQP